MMNRRKFLKGLAGIGAAVGAVAATPRRTDTKNLIGVKEWGWPPKRMTEEELDRIANPPVVVSSGGYIDVHATTQFQKLFEEEFKRGMEARHSFFTGAHK